MKKLFTLATLATAFCTAGYAQNKVVTGVREAIPSNAARYAPAAVNVEDTVTLQAPSFSQPCADTLYTFSLNVGGTLNGTNGYDDLEKAQMFAVDTLGRSLFAAIAYFRTDDATNPDVILRAYNMTGLDVDTNGFDSEAQGLATVGTRGVPTTFFWTNPVAVSDSFLVSVVLPNPADGDTLAVYSTIGTQRRSGSCVLPNDSAYGAWERLSDRTFVPIYVSYGASINVDFFIFAGVMFSPTATLSQLARETKIAPIPAGNSLAVILPGNLKGQNTWSLMGLDGKTVRQGSFNDWHTDINTASLNGVYTLRINTQRGPVTKRVVINN